MGYRIRIVISAVFVAAAAAGLFGQRGGPPPSPQQGRPAPPVFRSGVEAVQMDVFVTDKDGKPVSGLTKDDFELIEDDKPQVITTFAPVSMPIERREPLPFDAEPDVQSNEREYRHVYLILLGVMNEEEALKARYRVKQFLTEYFGDNDLAAIFAVASSRTQDGQDFTGNRRLLLEAIDKFNGQAAANKVAEDFWQHMELLARIPGERKSVLIFGNAGGTGPAASVGVGDIYDIIDYQGGEQATLGQEYAHAAIAAASHANIPIYPINPTGEVGFSPDSRMLAQLTGGFAHVGGNDYSATFERLVNETSTFYVLGFNSSMVRKQGRHIKLEAIVKRPGLTVRTRSGYVEQLASIRSRAPAEPKRTPVDTALANPLATTGLPMRVFAAPYKRWQHISTVALAIELDAAGLGFDERDGRFAADFEIHHLATDVSARIHPEFRHRGTLSLDVPTHAQVTQSGIRVVSQFDLPAGRYQVRVASARGATSGGVLYDLVVPHFEKSPLAMSGVALTSLAAADVLTLRPDRYRRSEKGATACRERVCQAGTTFDDVLTPYAGTKGGDAPLLRDVLPAPPTATRDFAATDTLALFTEVYDNARQGKKDQPATISLTATLHDAAGTMVRQASEQRSSRDKRRPSGGHGFTLRLPLEGLPAGPYVLRVAAGSNRNEKDAVSKSIPIRVK